MWVDNGLYWSAEASDKYPPPTEKTIDYAELCAYGVEWKLAVGVWDGDKYTPMNRDELEWAIKHGVTVKKSKGKKPPKKC